ncbi:MAG: CapA family protein [Magnetococcales bacterium]|nr:CapA family protein [Magnetococcales bacterium]MBF0437682.1 CapA family protein [Magnetococcales bacterium]
MKLYTTITIFLLVAGTALQAMADKEIHNSTSSLVEEPGIFRTPQGIHFNPTCQPGQRYRIVAVGDILLHAPLQKQAAHTQSFASLWRAFTPYFQQADMAYANLEGPVAKGVDVYGRQVEDPGANFDNKVYTSYPQFNYPFRLLDDLVKSGFDVVSTGNNHALDRGSLGIDRTIDALEKSGLQHTGFRRSDYQKWGKAGLSCSYDIHNLVNRKPWILTCSNRTLKQGFLEIDHSVESGIQWTAPPYPWQTIVRRNGLSVAWLACTYGTNAPDRNQQVLHCFKQAHEIKQLVARLKDEVDAVLITPHWGKENAITLQAEQVQFAKEMLESGALAILGSHPHTPQPIEKYLTKDGRETFILYSLGNFINGQHGTSQQSVMVLLLDLIKNSTTVNIQRVQFIPAFMTWTAHEITLMPLQAGQAHAGLTHLLKVLPVENRAFFSQDLPRDHQSPACKADDVK